MTRMSRYFVLLITLANIQSPLAAPTADFTAYQHKMPSDLPKDVGQDKSIRLIVRYYDAAIDTEIAKLDAAARQDKNYKASVTAFKAQRYKELKNNAALRMDNTRFKIERDYSHLPMNVVIIKGTEGLLRLLADPAVAEVYRDIKLQHFLAQSGPLIKSTEVLQKTGFNGSNTTVVVLDSGVNYTLADFGTCSAPGQPASCRVKIAQDLAVQDNNLDDIGHGTNVSGIVAGIAKGTQLAVFDVFDGSSADSSVVISGINWAIANQLSYNISSINMSLGDASQNATQCSSKKPVSPSYNPFVTPVANAFSAGILTVISSGNSGFSAGLAMPACTPQAVSVGAVYDSNVGGLNWSICTDNATSADQITCFSNSASYLTLLAPGALINAAGSSMGGTSQAAPHVSAAIAILRGARPTESVTSTLTRLTATGARITDTRNNLNFPRLDVLAALGSVNDDQANKVILSGGTSNGTVTTINAVASTQYASKEAGEPNHAGNAGGKSVWFEWTAPAAGNLTIDTHGSSFDTLLAVYTGSDISSLIEVASNDNDGSLNGTSGLSFVTTAGTNYKIAVDGFDGAFGDVVLNLRFDTNMTPPANSSVPVPAMPYWSFLLMGTGLIGISMSLTRRNPLSDHG